ncbi:MAG TPA: LysM peptidoglycan-binding domain-containing protein [Acidobacteriaceae bacterium]|nr:LysM peptidoglycan-binding domain-containing protein [Acidobacteriaceae bacterium]
MANLDQLKQKYAGVLSLFEKFAPYGAKLDTVELEGDKLHLKGEVPSTVVANRVWDEIKKADPTYSDLHHEIATTGGAEQEYTVKHGDTLSAICQLFYGNANKYPRVAEANGIDPNKLPAGKTLRLPVLQ